jgi:hypothetical protein
VVIQILTLASWAWIELAYHLTGGRILPISFGYFFLFANCCFLLERCVMLFISFRITTQSIQRAQDKFLFSEADVPLQNSSAVGKNIQHWLLANRRFFHQGILSYSKLIAFLFSLIWTVPSMIAEITLPSQGDAVKLGNTVLNVFYVIALIMICICSYYLKPVQENFKIKSELKKIAVLVVVVIFILVVVTFLTDWDRTKPVIIFSLEMCLVEAEVWLSLIRIVLLAKGIEVKLKRSSQSREKQKLNSASLSSPSDLRRSSAGEKQSNSHYQRLLTMLEDEKMRARFEKFLVKEFAVEGLLFWRAVDYFTSNYPEITQENAKEAVNGATAIYDEFCAPNAHMCINISFGCRQELTQVFKSQNLISKIQDDAASTVYIKPDTFDAAVKEVLTLLAQDSFRRFIQQVKMDKTSGASSTNPPARPSNVTVEIQQSVVPPGKFQPIVSSMAV